MFENAPDRRGRMGKCFCMSILLMMLMMFGSVRAFAIQQDKIKCVAGYAVQSMGDVDPRDAEASLRVWVREMGDPSGVQVDTHLYESHDKIIRDFLDKKLDFVVINTVDYLRSASVLKVKPEIAKSRNNKNTVKYVLLTQAAPGGLDALKNKKLAILKVNNLGWIYLNVYLMQAGGPDAESFFSSVQYKTKESQAILAVFFGQAEACLVTDTAFNTMTELNPQVGKKLRVMAESPEMIDAVGFFRRDYPPAYKQVLINGLHTGIKVHERGKQIQLLFNLEQMNVIKDSDLDSARKLMTDYDRLKKKKYPQSSEGKLLSIK